MAICKFVEELNRLKKSSSDSIDNIEKFDEFKKYMHVTRKAEEDLKQILYEVSNAKEKTLILLCGSAGDGKSHLLSFLKNEEKLLDNYIVYNDATESSAPSKTAIETLNDVLGDFSDARIISPGKNIILAINLGVLSNFIESTYGENFKQLRQYVEEHNILTTVVNKEGYIEGSHFQHVSFSDYHMYTLSDQGTEPEYILQILNKIFALDSNNPFYSKFQDTCQSCPMSQKCPVKHNYEFLTDNSVQRYIANSLVEVTLKEKEILTTREVLNYIYDILVANKFSYKKIFNASTITTTFLKEYLGDITPVLMFDYVDTSTLLNKLGKYDPLLFRSEAADEMAIFYYVSADVSEEIKKQVKGTPYDKVLTQKDTIDKLNDDKVLKAQMFNILVRLQNIRNEAKPNKVYNHYLQDLYYYNLGKIPKLGSLYDLVEKAIIQWCGSESGKTICLDESHEGFTLYEDIKFEAYLDDIETLKGITVLEKFIPSIVVKYENVKTKDVISLDIDYSLYELLYKLKQGYVQTADDRNNHADFISFIEKLLKTGSAEESILVVSEYGRKANIKRTKFGYKFEVMK